MAASPPAAPTRTSRCGRPASNADAVLDGHSGPIVDLAVSPDGKTLASASWDHTVRLWRLAGGAPRVLEGNLQNVNGVAFLCGRQGHQRGYDTTVRIWQLAGDAGVGAQAAEPAQFGRGRPDGEIVAAGASGKVFFLSPNASCAARSKPRRRRSSSSRS